MPSRVCRFAPPRSASTTITRRPRRASEVPSISVTTLFPTPPLPPPIAQSFCLRSAIASPGARLIVDVPQAPQHLLILALAGEELLELVALPAGHLFELEAEQHLPPFLGFVHPHPADRREQIEAVRLRLWDFHLDALAL